MFDLDEKFEKILYKYLPNKYKESKNDLIYSKVYSILQDKCLNKNVAMWGVGDFNNVSKTYVSQFLDTFADSLQNTKCIIDIRKELNGKKILGLPIISPEKIVHYDIDIILITSFRSRKYIAEEIKSYCPNVPYLDIYDELEKLGFPTTVDIFTENDKYVSLYYQRIRYQEAIDINDKEVQFETLLAMYADIKDIYYICKLIDECDIDDTLFVRKMSAFKSELVLLLNEVKKKISHRKDVIVWLQDAFRNVDWYDSKKNKFKILKKISERSVCFVNSYATAPVTYESVYSIITGKLPFEGKVYDSKFKFRVEQFKFLNKALEKEYGILLYTDERFDFLEKDNHLERYYKKYIPEIIWEILKQMCKLDGNILHFAYAFKELHVPFMCGFFSKEPIRMIFTKMGLDKENIGWEKIKIQFEDCLKYLDFELENFFEVLGKETMIVMLSDHAHVVYDKNENKPFYLYYSDLERSVKNVFMIYKKEWKHEVCSDFVSMIDFNQIASEIFEIKRFELPKRNKIYYQYYPIQNKTIRENASRFNGEDYINGIECCYDGEYIEVKTENKIEYIKKA